MIAEKGVLDLLVTATVHNKSKALLQHQIFTEFSQVAFSFGFLFIVFLFFSSIESLLQIGWI